MGQVLAKDFIPYDANGWRRLSLTYLNQLNENGDFSDGLVNGNVPNGTRGNRRGSRSLFRQSSFGSRTNYNGLSRKGSFHSLRIPNFAEETQVLQEYVPTGPTKLNSDTQTNVHSSNAFKNNKQNGSNQVNVDYAQLSFPIKSQKKRNSSVSSKETYIGYEDPSQNQYCSTNFEINQKLRQDKTPNKDALENGANRRNGTNSPRTNQTLSHSHDQSRNKNLQNTNFSNISTTTIKRSNKENNQFSNHNEPHTSNHEIQNYLMNEHQTCNDSIQKKHSFQRRINQHNDISLSTDDESQHYIPYRDYYIDRKLQNRSGTNTYSDFSGYSRTRRSQQSTRIGYTKTLFIIFALINICCTIWSSIYMAMTSKQMELGFPIQGKLYSKSDLSRHIWEWSIITFQLINNIINILAIYAALVDRYWIIWCYTWLMFLYGMFGSSSIMTKGGYSPWLIPLICGQISIALTHQIGIRLQFKKSRSIN